MSRPSRVKASDSYGRLIPPGDGSDTVGSSVVIEVNGRELDPLAIEPSVADGYVAELRDEAGVEPEHYMFTVVADADMVGSIQVQGDENPDETIQPQTLSDLFDDIRGRLRDGGKLPVQG